MAMQPPTYGGSSRLPPSYTQAPNEENAPLIPKASTDGKFTPNPRYNDVWASVLFLVNTLAYVGLNVYSFRSYANYLVNPSSASSGAFTVDYSLSILVLSSVAVSFLLSFGYFVLMQRAASFLIKFSFFFSIAFTIVMGVFQIMSGSVFFGGLMVLSGALVLFLYKFWAQRIPFSVIMLETVTSITRKYPGTVAVAFSGLITQILWSAFWMFSLAINYSVFWRTSNCRVEEVEDGKSKVVCDDSRFYLVMIYVNFVMFWNTEVIKFIVHVTISGVFGAYYFFEGSASGVPSSPTLSSAKRALTTSFGSICFGSLLIALLQTLRYILNSLRSDSDDGLAAFLAMCADCLLSMLESLFEIFNKFAFTQVAIYGKPYIKAAKDTWAMIKDRGVDALVNDSLVSNVLGMGMLTVSLLSGLYGYLFLKIVRPDFYQGDMAVTFIVVLLEVILGAVMMSVPVGVIDSGVTTTFVALAEDPQTLYRTKPQLFQAIAEHYPQVTRNVRGVDVVYD